MEKVAYKLKDTVLGEIVNKTGIVTKKLMGNNTKINDSLWPQETKNQLNI